MTGKPMERRFFPEGRDAIPVLDAGGTVTAPGFDHARMRWKHLTSADPAKQSMIVDAHVFPFLRTLGGKGTSLARHMDNARFTIPTPGLLSKLIAAIPMDKRDLYEYMLSKIASAGRNGQLRTPRHIIALMVAMVSPTQADVICDPACGTCASRTRISLPMPGRRLISGAACSTATATTSTPPYCASGRYGIG